MAMPHKRALIYMNDVEPERILLVLEVRSAAGSLYDPLKSWHVAAIPESL